MSEKNILGMVKSPCVAVCALDENDVCIGCYRTGEEITQWGEMNNAEKEVVLKKVAEREVASGNILSY
ncbi:DUF1289 domain-containing protein [Bermanella marisrubri]|uniref:Predicted Fe-S protein n=1 Tax=Bermanella marisrubri TaxID=207949 RepID=Q1N010_9GAMM|nr:DUF1289 domain-containing protein [Bermanella marisrubri]EAT11553.1 predicted Fe-S protein [Oceanobacter sp. RED65] [Bermanella marisrubri]QIZ84983.1 DUF1289 domain-containing protein [Bermanella marisrubri]